MRIRPKYSGRTLLLAMLATAGAVVAWNRYCEAYYTYPLANVVDGINHAYSLAGRPQLCVTEDFLVGAIEAQLRNKTGFEQVSPEDYRRIARIYRRVAHTRRVPMGGGFQCTENGVLWLVMPVPPDIRVNPGPGFGLIVRHPSIGSSRSVVLNSTNDDQYVWDGATWMKSP